MDSEKLIRVNLEMGADTLDKLGAVLEKLRLVLEAGGAAPASRSREVVTMEESGENRSFDAARFSSLSAPQAVRASEIAGAESADLPFPAFRRMEEAGAASLTPGQGPALPPSAGFEVQSGSNAYDEGRVTLGERLVTRGPAPLTAEAVSLAFRRDDRRYDNGFPLY